LPGSYSAEFTSKIHFNSRGIESWKSVSEVGKDAESYTATLVGGETKGDFDKCSALTDSLLHLDSNSWCDFAHGGECSFAGIYQPPLPSQSLNNFGEFFAFANYLHLWKFANLPVKTSIGDLESRAKEICAMSWTELKQYDKIYGKPTDPEELPNMCFLASYAHSMLSKGYGFSSETNITTASVINGQKVGWALGASLYEINTLPWEYSAGTFAYSFSWMGIGMNVFLLVCCMVLSYKVFNARNKRGFSVWDSKYMGYGSIEEEGIN
jgi:hypothetical protein